MSGGALSLRLPWHQGPWAHVSQQMTAGRFPHALLLCGVPGLGKTVFARALAQRLLCEAVTADEACGHCRACALNAAGNHPDLLICALEEGKRQLGVQTIRSITTFLALKSQYRRAQVAVVNGAELMSRAAANALLKTLEEPPDNGFLLLVSDRPSRLPATVRSRCQRLVFRVPDEDQALEWLAEQGGADPGRASALLRLAGGAPGRVLALAEMDYDGLVTGLGQVLADIAAGRRSVSDVVERWQTQRERLPELLAVCLRAVIRLRVQPSGAGPDQQELVALARGLPAGIEPELHRFLQVVQSRQALEGFALNDQIAAEELLIEWERMTRGGQRCSLSL